MIISRIRQLTTLGHQFLDVRRARRLNRAPASLPLLSLELTEQCNARCATCGYAGYYPPTASPLTTGEYLELVAEAARLGTGVISLGGGEPFLHRDCDRLIRRIADLGIMPLVHTNGSRLSPRRRKLLASVPRLTLSLSVDSHRREIHDGLRGLACFDRICAASAWFVRHAPHIRLVWLVTISRHNVGELLPIVQLASALGVRAVRFTPAHENLQHRFRDFARPLAPEPDRLPALRQELGQIHTFCRRHRMLTNSAEFLRSIPEFFADGRRTDCYAGFLFYSVDAAGQLFPCYDHQPGIDLRTAGGLEAAINHPEMTRLRSRVLTCTASCWNVGCAEPSLRMRPASTGHQLVRELRFFHP